MRHWRKLLLIIATWASTYACAHVKPYEKEYLLNPLMDDGTLRSLTSDFGAVSFGAFERLSSNTLGASAATSCPTCGG